MSYVDTFARWARDLEEREATRSGVTLPIARKIVARRLRVAPGTLENLIRGRLKDIGHSFAERLKGVIADELRREIARMEEEMRLVRAGMSDAGCDEVAAAEHAIEQARRLLRKGS